MDLDTLRDERKKWLTWKNIVPYQEAIKTLKTYEDVEVKLGDRVEVQIPNLIATSRSISKPVQNELWQIVRGAKSHKVFSNFKSPNHCQPPGKLCTVI